MCKDAWRVVWEALGELFGSWSGIIVGNVIVVFFPGVSAAVIAHVAGP